jgi:hypothetical protein
MKNTLRKIPFLEGLFHTAPPYHTGSVWQNVLGWQLVRIYSRNLLHSFRRRPETKVDPKYIEALRKDGVVAMEDFLSPQQWAEVKGEYEKAKKEGFFKFTAYKPSENPSMQISRVYIDQYPDKFPMTLKYLHQNQKVLDLAGDIIKKDLKNSNPTIFFLLLQKDEKADYDDDIENILHADVHYPTAKAFFFLNDVTRKNGPFVFALGSHKMNGKRMSFEYNMSIRTAKLKRGDKDIPEEFLEKRGKTFRNIISKKQYEAMRVNEHYFEVSANTMVVSNNVGFHRRGEFEPNQIRELIQINFRSYETSWIRKKLNKGNSRQTM